MQQNKKQNIIYSLILIAYAIFTLVLVFHHEVWRDEAQVWLVARDLDFFGIIKHVRTEGHPLLWYFLVMPLTRIFHGFNAVMSMQILNWLFVVAGVGVFLFKSPFNFFLKISLVLSSGFLYWYPVIARSYCLIPILVFLLASLYKKQKEHPFVYAGLLIALANTHVIMFGFCGALALIFAWQFKDEIKTLFNKDNAKIVYNKIQLVAPLLVFIALLSIVLYLWGSHQENSALKTNENIQNLYNITNVLGKIVFNILGFENLFYNIVFYTILLFCGYLIYTKDKKIFLVYVANLSLQFYICLFIWSIILPQRAYILLLIAIFCLWTLWEKFTTQTKTILNLLLCFFLLSSTLTSLKLTKHDYLYEHSEGKSTAKFIQEKIPENAFIVTNSPEISTSISAYLPKDKWKMWYVPYNCHYTFTHWNKTILSTIEPIPVDELLKNHNELYVIIGGSNTNTLTEEEFKIAKVK